MVSKPGRKLPKFQIRKRKCAKTVLRFERKTGFRVKGRGAWQGKRERERLKS